MRKRHDGISIPMKYKANTDYKTIPDTLRPNALALYTTRPQGLTDYALPMTNAVTNGDASNGLTGWTAPNGGVTASDGVFTITANGTTRNLRQVIPLSVIGDKYAVVLEIIENTLVGDTTFRINGISGSNFSGNVTVTATIGVKTVVIPVTTAGTTIDIAVIAAATSGVLSFKNVMLQKLTTIFGLSNEPTASEFTDMLTYAGTTFWNGSKDIVINPNDKYYWPDRSGNGRHLHLVNLAYDATGGLQAGPPANYLFDGVNDYAKRDNAVDMVAAQGAFSVFGMYQAKASFASPHRLFQVSDAGTTLCGDLAISATAVTFTVQDSTSGTSVATITAANVVDTWVGVTCTYDPVTKKAGISRNGSAVTLGDAITNGSRKFNRIAIACNYLLNAFNNDRVSEFDVLNKTLSDAECKSIFNNVASRYGLPKSA